ncbi:MULTISPECIES: RICIN domain-containing protein [unclassified Streptomyces]|uniref:RICIN domain-containing protein n=1 Tax=unclassified Streptomyces TaxID=2593676 RepID=UPI0038262F7B
MKQTRIGRAGIVATLIAILFTVAQAPASAAPSGWHRLESFKTGQAVGLKIGQSWTKKFSVPGSEYQFLKKTGGYYEVVQNDKVWICLDSNHAGKVYGHSCNGGDFQRWRVEELGTKWTDFYQRSTPVYRLINKATGRCLDANYDGDLYTLGCNGGTYQMWMHLAPWR